jgi:hypothetical protein
MSARPRGLSGWPRPARAFIRADMPRTGRTGHGTTSPRSTLPLKKRTFSCSAILSLPSGFRK